MRASRRSSSGAAGSAARENLPRRRGRRSTARTRDRSRKTGISCGWRRRHPAAARLARAGAGGAARARSRILTRLMRRGSASSTSKSKPATASTTSPFGGMRPVAAKTRPPIVSMSSAFSPTSNSGADHLARLLDAGARIGDEDAVVDALHARVLVEIVLVLDLADDDLDQILERDESVGPAVFVDDQRHLRAARLHALQQSARRHRRRHEEHRPHQLGAVERAGQVDVPKSRSAARAAHPRPAGSAPCRRTRPSGRGCGACRSGRRASRG